MARKTKQVTFDHVALTRLTYGKTGQVFERYQPFPSGLEVDYEHLLSNKYIATYEQFQNINPIRCNSCGD